MAGVLVYKIFAHFFREDAKLESAIVILLFALGLTSVLMLVRYSPQSLFLNKTYNEVIQGEEYYIDFRKADVVTGFIKFENGTLTVKNRSKELRRDANLYKYSEYDEISAEVYENTKMSKLYIDYNYTPDETLLKFEKLTYEELEKIKPETSVSFNLTVTDGKWIARDICVSSAKEPEE